MNFKVSETHFLPYVPKTMSKEFREIVSEIRKWENDSHTPYLCFRFDNHVIAWKIAGTLRKYQKKKIIFGKPLQRIHCVYIQRIKEKEV